MRVAAAAVDERDPRISGNPRWPGRCRQGPPSRHRSRTRRGRHRSADPLEQRPRRTEEQDLLRPLVVNPHIRPWPSTFSSPDVGEECGIVEPRCDRHLLDERANSGDRHITRRAGGDGVGGRVDDGDETGRINRSLCPISPTRPARHQQRQPSGQTRANGALHVRGPKTPKPQNPE